jgi:hypothetical protein
MDAPAISRTASWNSRCARVFLRVLPGFLGKLVLTSPPLSLPLSRRAAARLETGRTTTHGGPQERYPQRISGWYQSSAKEQPVRCGVKLLNLHSRSYLPTFRAASPTHSRLRHKHALVLTRSPLCVTQVFLGVWEKDLPCFQKAISDPTSLSSSSTGLAA